MNFRHCIVFLSCLFYFGTVFSQEKDSLLTSSYQDLKQNYFKFQRSAPKIAKLYSDALVTKAIQENNTLEKHSAYIKQAYIEGYFGDLSKAISLLNESIAYAIAEENEKMLLSAISRKGTIYYDFGKYNDAITYYLKIDSLARIRKNIDYQVYSNQNIGAVKTALGDHEEAAKLFLKNEAILFPLIDQKKYSFKYLNTLIGLCSAYTYFDEQAAEKYATKIKEHSEATNDQDALSYYYVLKGILLYQQKEYSKGLEALQKAEKLIVSLGKKNSLFTVYQFQGKIHFDTEKYDKAIAVFEKIKTLKDEIRLDHFEYKEVIHKLALSYSKIANEKKAIENFKLSMQLNNANDTIRRTVNTKIKDLYDNKTIQEKIEALQKQANEKEWQRTSLIYVSFGLLLIIIILIILYRKYKINNKQKFDIILKKLQQVETEKATKSIVKTTEEKQLPDEKVLKILTALQKFEDKKLFLHNNTSLVNVAKKLNTNTSYLSKIINTHKGQTFINYITQLRIDYVLHQLKNDKLLRSYSIKAIAEELGFKSEGVFSRAFKKQTGIYPSFFIKNLTSDS
ncbi:AraC family transcriptional regulator [Kordia sp. YSTF-M3]|uniref:AraC family transcriptional regulator n=1 Tax=Kordia aestuariivivens TaxID=2759037 RepID=A0ABR7QAJ6_9FLAO|nr:helix-turn-helix domain-containing protein [Kordia aestuariivivens]MBC8755570.1 AraC family transcriptional regulator [Kordia aestuariivivens]